MQMKLPPNLIISPKSKLSFHTLMVKLSKIFSILNGQLKVFPKSPLTQVKKLQKRKQTSKENNRKNRKNSNNNHNKNNKYNFISKISVNLLADK
jgi:hypothetical protein